MSSKNSKKVENSDFIDRFKEVCGSSQPAEVARLLKISYQAAKNYLNGIRLPDSSILLLIAKKTPYSIHWLLTGEGEKFADVQLPKKIEIELSAEIEEKIEAKCQEIVDRMLKTSTENKEVKTLRVKNVDIKQERPDEKVISSTDEEDDLLEDDSSKD